MSKRRILIIDYEPRSVQKLQATLEQGGYDVTVAGDGLAGMAMFEKIRPDLALIEAMIPKKHGFEVCQELKKSPHGKNTPIIIITAVYKGRKYRSQAIHNYGCDEYLEKPIPEDHLLDTVRRFLPPATPTVTAAEIESEEDTAPAAIARPIETAEAEILDRLDQIMPGDSRSKPKAQILGPEQNLLSFDPERARKRSAGYAPTIAVGRSSSGGAVCAPLTRPDLEPFSEMPPTPGPTAVESPEQDPDPRRPLATPSEESSKGSFQVWVWLLAGLALMGAGAALILAISG